MPAISRFRGIIVRLMKLPYRGLAIYANRGEQEIVLDAATLKVIAGTASTWFVFTVIEWARLHESELKESLAVMQGVRVPGRVAQRV